MPQIDLEGTGASIAFASPAAGFTANLISLTLPEKTKEELPTTHLGSTEKTYKPAKLVDYGSLQAVFDHDPAEEFLIEQDNAVEVTISYPLLDGEATPTKIQGDAFVTSEGGEEMAVDTLMRTNATIRWAAKPTIVEPTQAS